MEPQIPLLGQIGLWAVSALLLTLLVVALVSLSRSPLDERRRLPWLLGPVHPPGDRSGRLAVVAPLVLPAAPGRDPGVGPEPA